MISNTDFTLLVYSTAHIPVKVYTGKGPRQRFQSACGDAPSDAFLAGAIQSAARSGRFSVEAGTRAAAPFPAPISPLAASFLRCAPDRFHLTKPNTFQHNREASVATLRWCSGSRNAVRLPFGTGVQLRRNPHLVNTLGESALTQILHSHVRSRVALGEPIQNHPSRARQTVHAKILSASFFTAALRQFPGKLRERCCPRRFCVSRRRSWGPSAAFATRPRGQGAVTAAECSRSDSSILRHPKRPKQARVVR